MSGSEDTKSTISINWDKAFRRLILIVGIGVIFNLIFSYFISGDFKLKHLVSFSPLSLGLAFLFAILPWISHAIEILIWARFFKNRMSFNEALKISVATDLGSAITPTMVGGAPIKLGMLMRKGLSSGQSAAMVLFTGVEDFIFFLIIIPCSIILSDRIGWISFTEFLQRSIGSLPRILLVIAITLVVIGVLLFVFRKTKFGEKLKDKVSNNLNDFKRAMSLIWNDGKLTLLLATIAIGSRWVTRFFILVVLVAGYGTTVDLVEVYFSEWLVYMGMTVTPTPGAIGGAEGAFYLVYRGIIPDEALAPIVFMWRFFNYYLLLILAALFLNLTTQKLSRSKPS